MLKFNILGNKKTPHDCGNNHNGVIRSDLVILQLGTCIMPYPDKNIKSFDSNIFKRRA